jgi:hypothetical protein
MRTLKLILGTVVICISLTSCDSDNNDIPFSCEKQVVISAHEYNTAPNDQLEVHTLEINEDCLKIIYSSSGCNGDTWLLELIDSEAILESNPPQRNLRLSLKNEELCDAYITTEITFEISDLQVEGNKVLLNLTNSDLQILYKY